MSQRENEGNAMDRTVDENKIAIIIYKLNEEAYNSTVSALQRVKVPDGFQAELVVLQDIGNIAARYNNALKQTDAKYKVYFLTSVSSVSDNILEEAIKLFHANPQAGMVGLLGGAVGIYGDYRDCKKMYGRYQYTDEENIIRYKTENPLFVQDVTYIEPSIIITSTDYEWDEQVGDYFFVAAQCCKMKRNGKTVVVPMQNKEWIVWAEDSPWLDIQSDDEYERERKIFSQKYMEILRPLVSILIPTYNQPVYFQEALESALKQDYDNIEIIIGDDSTNDETKKLIKPYLEKYSFIKYYNHGGQSGYNLWFILNHSNGKFINYLFHDDLFYPQKISRMMSCVLSDLSERTVLVTSLRDCIDDKGNVLGLYWPWEISENVVIDGDVAGRKMLFNIENFIGEATTALIKKECLWDNESQSFYVERFCGLSDDYLGDAATWLDVCRDGGDCVFIAEALSAFRFHRGQNTWNPEILLGGALEWMNYYLAAWYSGHYIKTWQEYTMCCTCWQAKFKHLSTIFNGRELSEKAQQLYSVYMNLYNAIEAKEFEKVLHITAEYRLSYLTDREKLLKYCRKNLVTGYWEKKN